MKKCPSCFIEYKARSDNKSLYCRKCRCKINSKNKKPIDISFQKFGKLQTSDKFEIKKKAFWFCLCDCGNMVYVCGHKLRSGKTKSCGCLNKKLNGYSKTPTYRSYKAMLQRCYDSSVKHYQRYGAKGIEVCERWKISFFNFLEDMGERPQNHTLDRINAKLGYHPENCRWATQEMQTKNISKGNFLEYNGEIRRLTDLARQYNISWSTLRKRIFNLKWPLEKALTKKIYKKGKK